MKSFDCSLDKKNEIPSDEDHSRNLLINKRVGSIGIENNQVLTKCSNGFKILSMGQNGRGYRNVPTTNIIDLRCQSLPDCVDLKVNGNFDSNKNCDSRELQNSDITPPSSPKNESWFKTWPERCDKLKSNETSPILSQAETPNKQEENTHCKQNCDNLEKNIIVKSKVTLNEALQNISLAYSPVTKQLHLVEPPRSSDSNTDTAVQIGQDVEDNTKKLGHRRTEAGSFSSTISTLSDPSTSGSLLGSDDRSLSSFEVCSSKPRKKSITNFLSKHVFSWKTSDPSSTSVWKIFTRHSSDDIPVSPVHVASSSALIQHERPSNLPAKTLEEEQRHRDEYKAILAAAKKKDAQTNAAKQKQQKLLLKLEEQQAAATKHFSNHVLTNWEVMRTNKKTLDLWWQGLPSSVRGKVWRLAIGNELNLTAQLYEICLCRAQNRLNSPEPPQVDADVDPESSMDVIQLDISRTFPNLCIFQEGGPYSETLHSLLAAYVCYRPDVGYVQGMSFIAAILILNMEQLDAFICFANLVNQPLHLAAFTLNQEHMQAYYSAYNQVFKYNLPKLYSHFERSGLTPDLYLLDWIYTIFAKAMPLDIACRVWDIFLRDGYEFIFRTALGILHLNQDFLLEMDFIHGAQFLTRLPDDMSSDQLFRSIQLVNTSIGKNTFSQIVDRCIFSSESYRELT